MRFQPSSVASFSIALAALATAVSALPLADDSTNLSPPGHNITDVDKRANVLPEDCQWAQYFTSNVDCYFKHKGSDDWLNYIVQITATGQNSDGWCKGIEVFFFPCRIS